LLLNGLAPPGLYSAFTSENHFKHPVFDLSPAVSFPSPPQISDPNEDPADTTARGSFPRGYQRQLGFARLTIRERHS